MAIGDLGATDIFGLGGNFHPQSSSTSTNQDITEVLGSNGDIQCLTPFNEVTTASAEYEVCGTGTLTSFGLGSVVNGYIVNSVEIAHSAGSAPTVRIEGMSFGSATVTEKTYAITESVDITTVAGESVGDEPTEVSYMYECEITQSIGSDGSVSYAVSRTPKVTYTESGLGTLTNPTLTDWTLESFENSDSNQETDTYTVTFVKELASV